tara:strand:- start:241 stop:918 length:678 start_codon:yes stop_codon:yes gene_type:complete
LGKRLSEKDKKALVESFKNGKTIKSLSEEFSFTILTIIRNLKKLLGESVYKELSTKNKKSVKISANKKNKNNENSSCSNLEDSRNDQFDNKQFENQSENNFLKVTEFIEIVPLNLDVDNSPQKDLTSISINEVNFPSTVYMIVDKKVELETKYLKDYPRWQFLSQDELERKTIEIFLDIKSAKSVCQKDQKVIKVPNSNVFKIVAPILCSRGISRIVSAEKLIAL